MAWRKGSGVVAYRKVKNKGSQSAFWWRRALPRNTVAYSLFGLLAVSNIFTLVALFMAPELSGLLDRRDEQAFSSYENRILQLRMEVDRLHSRQYRQDGDLNLQMQELTQQQEFLAEQHRYVRILAEKAAEMGLSDNSMDIASAEPDDLPVLISGALTVSPPLTETESIGAISQSIDDMLSESRQALTSINVAAEESTAEIVDSLSAVGIRLSLESKAADAVGGPFIPAADNSVENSLANSANGVMEALERFQQARESLTAAPIHYPFATVYRISSRFGTRSDPFQGSAAFHSGLDFAAPSGTSVLAAGDGQVSFAGQRSGYGNVVEIDHGNGIISRYAHLSAILVRKGQVIASGDVVARVGSTGRSTGPHLHFEVRRNGSPQNPSRYLDLAQNLRNYLI